MSFTLFCESCFDSVFVCETVARLGFMTLSGVVPCVQDEFWSTGAFVVSEGAAVLGRGA